MLHGKLDGNQGAQTMSNEGNPKDAHGIHKTIEKFSLFCQGVAFTLCCIAKPPQIQRVGAVADGSSLHGGNPVPPGPHPAVQEEEWSAAPQHLVMHNIRTQNNNAHFT